MISIIPNMIQCDWLSFVKEVLKGLPVFFLSTPSSKQRSVENIMSEVMISRRSGGDSGGTASAVFRSFSFVQNESWTVPNHVINNEFSVRLFGGGGGGDDSQGGGSGWMVNDIVKIASGEVVNITIGAGGIGKTYYSNDATNTTATDGGTTSFGHYLSAPGGSKNGWGGTGAAKAGAYMFGGGGARSGSAYLFGTYASGDGGPWGGGGGGGYGSGGIYGGGGGAFMINITNPSVIQGACSGGRYGGGGGIYYFHVDSTTPDTSNRLLYNGGLGGEYGGHGGMNWYYNSKRNGTFFQATNGINTIGWTNVQKLDNNYLNGYGTAGFNSLNGVVSTESYMYRAGGGGFGGNGGAQFGGGGGYGSNGGTYGGGGGGYGGDGGHNNGGGGGYGKNAIGGNNNGTGAGYYTPGISNGINSGWRYAGAPIFGSYGRGGWGGTSWTGSSSISSNGGTSGIAIVEFYQKL